MALRLALPSSVARAAMAETASTRWAKGREESLAAACSSGTDFWAAGAGAVRVGTRAAEPESSGTETASAASADFFVPV